MMSLSKYILRINRDLMNILCDLMDILVLYKQHYSLGYACEFIQKSCCECQLFAHQNRLIQRIEPHLLQNKFRVESGTFHRFPMFILIHSGVFNQFMVYLFQCIQRLVDHDILKYDIIGWRTK